VSTIEERILALLKAEGIEYEVFEHEPVYTCRKMAELLKTDEGCIAKSMIVKKSDAGLVLAVLPGNMKIDFLRLAAVIKSRLVFLAPREEAEKIAGCSVGCVYPLGNLVGLETVFDDKLLREEYVYFNPGSHTKSVKINTQALVKLVKPTIAEFT
jgi:prolyl-tRNA editing enzyme YbaK/EbsC (Cys-tRNA(Pro) deacylase)